MSIPNYVLVPGAWVGAWVWHSVEQALRARKQAVRAMTLSGLEATDTDVSGIRLATHVQEVVQLIQEQNLQNVVLVGHGYGGLVVGQAADQLRDRVVRAVYVDAWLPKDRVSLLDQLETGQQRESRPIVDEQGRWPAPDADALEQETGLSTEHARFLSERFVGHPGHTITDAAVLGRPLDYQDGMVVTSSVGGIADYPDPWPLCRLMEAGPWPMLSAPSAIADLLMQKALDPAASCAAV